MIDLAPSLQRSLMQWAIGLFAFIVLASNSLFIVSPAEQVIIFQFREKMRVIQAPGLYAKVPFIQEAMFFDRRVLALEPPSQVVILDEQKLLDVDAFGRWQIRDPLLFFQSLRDERNATDRLNGLLNSSIRNILGSWKVSDLLSDKREDIMELIKEEMNAAATRFGVEIVDVRLRQTDLPAETVQNVYDRMRSERQREAAALRSEGQKLANETRAKAEAERTRLLSEAQRDAQRLRGEGDKEAFKILADATGRDPQFFAFYRTLEAYRNALKSSNTTYILTPDSGFFRAFRAGER